MVGRPLAHLLLQLALLPLDLPHAKGKQLESFKTAGKVEEEVLDRFLGGTGNIPGAMLGGLFLGSVESVGPFLFLEGLGVPSPNQLKDAIAFTLLVLVLIFRPTGILGERVTKRA